MDAATRVQTPNDTADRAPGGAVEPVDWRQGYGFQYWRSRHGYRGDGAFGQFVIIWPEEDAVIVTTAETVDMAGLLEEITTHLRPAMSGAGTEAADTALGERLAGLALPLPEDTGADFSAAVDLAQEPGEAGPFSSGVAAPGAERVEVIAARRGWTLRLSGDGIDVTLPVGRSRWLAGEWPAPDDGLDAVPFRSAGGTGTDGSWHAELRMIQTPHTLRVDIAPGGEARLAWRYPPLRGDGPAGHALPTRP